MDIESVRDFYKLARFKSISKLAAASNISQPALSLQLQRLEAQVGHTLFTRSNKGIELTDAGEIMEKYARSFVTIYENMMHDFESLKKDRSVFRIFCTCRTDTDRMVRAMENTCRQFPQLFIVKSFFDPDEIYQRLKSGECDIGIFPFDGQQDTALSYTPLYTDRLVLAADRECHLPSHIAVENLKDYPLYLLPEEHYLSMPVRSYFLACRLSVNAFNVACVFDDMQAVKKALIQGKGLAFLPEACVKNEFIAGILRKITLEGFEYKDTVYFVTTEQMKRDKSASSLMKYLLEQITRQYTD